MSLDGFRHEEIVFLARSIDTRWTQHHKRQPLAHAIEERLGSELAFAIGGVGLGRIGITDFLVGLLLTNRTEDAQRAQVDQSLQWHVHLQQSLHQMARAFGVHAEEVLLVLALRHTRCMHHVGELMTAQLLHQPFLRIQVELDELDAVVLQKLLRTAAAHSCPHLISSLQTFLHDETSDEATGSCDKYFFHTIFSFPVQRYD